MGTKRSMVCVACLVVAQICLATGLAQASKQPALAGSLPEALALFAGTAGGTLLRADSGAHWRSRQNLDGQGISALVAAHDTHTLYAGTAGGVWRSTDGGAHWQATNDGSIGTPSINALAVNPRQPAVVYAGAGDGLYQTTDGGASWLDLTNGLPTVAVLSLAVDARNPASVWAGTDSSGLYHSPDGGSTWNSVSDDVLSPSASVQAIALSPASSAVIYAGTSSGLYQSTDGGSSWVLLDNGLSGSVSINSVAMSPRQPSRVYAGTSDGAFFSTDGGSTWQQGGGDLSNTLVHSIVADPGNPFLAYAGTTQGVFRTTDGGQTWADWSGDAMGYGVDVTSLAPDVIQKMPTDPAAPGCCGARFFSQTNHNLGGVFLSFWQRYGGLDTFGYPRTEPFADGGHLVQYTDRFRLDLINGRVTTAPLGRLLTAGRFFPAVAPFASNTSYLYFGATGHGLSGRFLAYWRGHAGATLLGAPIAEPDREPNNDGTGRVYLVQWCEKGRLEYHAELTGTKYEVQLGLVGKQDLQRRGWL